MTKYQIGYKAINSKSLEEVKQEVVDEEEVTLIEDPNEPYHKEDGSFDYEQMIQEEN